MTEDDIDSLTLDLNDFMLDSIGVDLNDEEYDLLRDFLYGKFEWLISKERNYN
jgi:hypothetical protein